MNADGAPSDAAQALPDVRSEHSGSFVRLAQLWGHPGHFSLVLAAVDNIAYRDALIERLGQIAPAERMDLGPELGPDEWLIGAERAQLAGSGRLHLCFPLDRPRGALWWQQANVLRERLADALPGIQVLWLSDADIDAMAHQAPDLWNWREMVVSFTAVVTRTAEPVAGSRFEPASGKEAVEVMARLQAIEQYLARSDLEGAGSANLHLEAAQAYWRLGQMGRSAEHARIAALAFSKGGDELHAAQAKAQIARCLHVQGQPNEALRLLTSEVLPVFDRLGDVRSRAVTMGKIADVLQARGDLEEALRIRREEQLPVYEQLGDVRELLVGRVNLAVGLHLRGHGADSAEAARLLALAHQAAQQMQLPEASQVAQLYQKLFGMSPP
ncbi:MAG TPA: hypothetical protein VLA61_25010 [Ideonella sp.]|uniref:hypothetical protein n=1 Tax=Ideonella sp. TaxID=1929293 RepID=UPI002B5E7DAB|nr:hypothetical protein [Ideonella sp.]HSI51542.1 hypothetical protein [Ideonella sp.]